MKCPLFTRMWTDGYGQNQIEVMDCLEGECAWWEPNIGKCSVLRMWIALQDIHEVLHNIAKELTLLRPRGS